MSRLTFIFLFIWFSGFSQSHDFSSSDVSRIKALSNEWSESLNCWNLKKLKKLYGTTVLFYGSNLSPEKCIEKKAAFLKPSDSFAHSITTSITVSAVEDGIIKAEFSKRVTINGNVKDYLAYLLFKHNGFDYKIVGESDDITDKRFGINQNSEKNKTVSGSNDRLLPTAAWVVCGIIFSLGIFIFLIKKRSKVLTKSFHTASGTASNETSIPECASDMKIKEDPHPVEKQSALEVGHEFEKFVVNKFNQNYFRCLEWKGDKSANGIIPEGNSNPDLVFHFELREFKRKFAVECKFRGSLNDKGDVYICSEEKLAKYIAFGKEHKLPVYLILGLKGEPYNPQELFIVPMNKVSPVMSYGQIKRFIRSNVNRLFYDPNKDELT